MSKTKKMKIILSIVAISFIQGLQYCVSPVLGQIQEHYADVSVSLVQMLITAPALLSMVVALVSGSLVVKISKKRLLIFAGLTAGVTGLIPFLSDSFILLFISRAIYGISLGLATALNVAVVADFFEGDERVSVMGIQAASVGAGMVVVTTLGGLLGSELFQKAYYINIIGFISMAIIALCLPETGPVKVTGNENISLNKEVFKMAVFSFLEFFFLITFTTNIAMHLSGSLSGNTEISGYLTGIFSAAQIVIGLVLGIISKIAKKYTLSAAMLSFCIGGILLVLFPDNLMMLMIGSIFCGFSQGVFIPTIMVDAASAVNAASTAMASACLTCAMNFGQLLSPTVMNSLSSLIFGEETTTNVYLLAVIGMAISATVLALCKKKGILK